DLYRIILEEYLISEGFGLAEDRVDDLLAAIKAGKMPKDLEHDRTVPDPPEVPGGDLESASETYPMEVPHSADMSDEDIVASISKMIQGRDPVHVSELFQAVFAQIPGVEMGDTEEEELGTQYGGKEFDRRKSQGQKAGFELEELVGLIKEVLSETEWYDLTSGESPPPHSTTTEEEPDSYEKLMAAYHALEDVLGQYPHLQDAFDSVAGALDAVEAGDSYGARADESLKEEWGSAGDCVAKSKDKRVKKAVEAGAERVLVFDSDCNLMNPEEIDATLTDLEAGVALDDLFPPEMY
ncbi:MAG: hypothetical protein HOB02_07225, partial [Proteobacteria bacterium]|nr:hypothetical protein [Pseudomonadota bacterium]